MTQSFLVDAGTLYLVQKADQEKHQSPRKLHAELKSIHRLAVQLSEKLERLPEHESEFRRFRLNQLLPFGCLRAHLVFSQNRDDLYLDRFIARMAFLKANCEVKS
jgi:hypothetical protein